MKNLIRTLTVIVLALAVFGQHGDASAGGGGALTFKGPSALANFSSYDGSGCILTQVSVIGSDSVRRDVPGPSTSLSFASVTVSQYDICNQVQLLFAYGSATPLDDSAFQVAKKLGLASLTASAYMFEELSGTNFNLDLNLTWTATGALTRSHNHSNFHSPGCVINSHSNDRSRVAQVAGTITDGVTNFTPESSSDAYITFVQNGTIVAGCK